MKRYNIFISHSWTYSDSYSKLKLLLTTGGLVFSDYSVPQSDPIHTNGTDAQLKEAIRNKIRNCSVVLILAGVYSTYSKWINYELEIAALEMGKPVIAIEPWGSERTSSVVKDNATMLVKWNTNSIIQAIEKVTSK